VQPHIDLGEKSVVLHADLREPAAATRRHRSTFEQRVTIRQARVNLNYHYAVVKTQLDGAHVLPALVIPTQVQSLRVLCGLETVGALCQYVSAAALYSNHSPSFAMTLICHVGHTECRVSS
jgi:hypothetical protein